jgi:hypothetical protein
MLKLTDIIPQNLHLHLLYIIPILRRRIHLPIRLTAPENPPTGYCASSRSSVSSSSSLRLTGAESGARRLQL